VATWQSLRVGDRIRPVSIPSEWLQRGYQLPVETMELWTLLISRRRPIRIFEVDEWGSPWVR
jgi:hypothetical protein